MALKFPTQTKSQIALSILLSIDKMKLNDITTIVTVGETEFPSHIKPDLTFRIDESDMDLIPKSIRARLIIWK